MNRIILYFLLIGCAFMVSFSTSDTTAYEQQYQAGIRQLKEEQAQLLNQIKQGSKSPEQRDQVFQMLYSLRIRYKYLDFWLRYLEPNAYKQINGVLPVEWETEVFEKFEKPYKRPGAGWYLAAEYLQEDNANRDSLFSLIQAAQQALDVFESDSIQTQMKDPGVFYFCNRLFLLNLASIYTTGFECPDTSMVIMELKNMLPGVGNIYKVYNQCYPSTSLSQDYLNLYEQAISFLQKQPDTAFYTFNHFLFIRDFVNPLFRINQALIRKYQFETISRQDYTLNSQVNSIFDKNLYQGQETKGIYFYVKDSAILRQISEVGKLLFFDPILSGNNKRSCASCHKPSQGFTDTLVNTAMQFNQTEVLPRNTPSLLNAIHYQLLMLDGKHISLQNQAKDVTTNPKEMGSQTQELVEKVLAIPTYRQAFKSWLKYTPTEKEVNIEHIASALTLYYGSLSFYDSPFDRAMNSTTKMLDPEVIKGFNVFMGKAQCGTCHFVPQFNGTKPPYISSEFEVLGVPEDTNYLRLSQDVGRFGVHAVQEMDRAFRTPTLRNITKTKPYFHHGGFRNLAQVIEFYNAGGGKGKGLGIENQTLSADSLRLNPEEKHQLIVFMKSLTEDIPEVIPPNKLPESTNKKLNNRILGGIY
ncbi:MAG: cytochrome C peroxidase [Bacteroidia bacterium]|nr:cytochrome C peroxidase [Bacteroidia bacterium]